MLKITIPEQEAWDEEKQEFRYFGGQTLALEHSLVSLSKWESKWEKPFLGKQEKTEEETLDYIRCMTITQNVDSEAYRCLTAEQISQVNRYIDSAMTATTFSEKQSAKGRRQTVTAELIYYWMIALNIPFECQKWHLNRLLTLIRICNIKSKPASKMSQKDILRRNSKINNARRKRHNTKG